MSSEESEVISQDANVAMVNKLINDLFKSMPHPREHYESVDKALLPNDFSAYIAPFVFCDAKAKEVPTGLVQTVTSFLDPSTSLTPLSVDEWKKFESVLVMRPPKKVTRYTPSHVPLTETMQKKKRSRPSSAAATAHSQKLAKQYGHIQSSDSQFQPQVASIYEEADTAEGLKRARKVARQSSEDSSITPGDVFGDNIIQQQSKPLPQNFYEVIYPLFNEFFEEEYEDISLKYAFIARIDQSNCKTYKLNDFAPKSSSFGVILDKLDSREYNSEIDFYADFKQGLENVRMYFPENHPAKDKALEIWNRFRERWDEVVKKFIY